MTTPTLISYWEQLSVGQRRYIYESLRTCTASHRTLPLAMLPFVKVPLIIQLMEKAPHSQWTAHYWNTEAYEDFIKDFPSPYARQRAFDVVEARNILAILRRPPNGPNKMSDTLAEYLKRMEEANA